jgi:hypothetical protein
MKFLEKLSSLRASKVFEDNFMIVAHLIAAFTLVSICTFFIVVSYPIIYFLIFNERILHFGLELPFIDWKYSWIGYGINFFHQGFFVLVFFTCSVQGVCVIICFITSGICQYDLLEILLDELNELILNNKDGSNDNKIRSKVNFLVESHINLIRYLEEMRQTFMIYYFVELAALVFQKTVELFAIVNVSFY